MRITHGCACGWVAALQPSLVASTATGKLFGAFALGPSACRTRSAPDSGRRIIRGHRFRRLHGVVGSVEFGDDRCWEWRAEKSGHPSPHLYRQRSAAGASRIAYNGSGKKENALTSSRESFTQVYKYGAVAGLGDWRHHSHHSHHSRSHWQLNPFENFTSWRTSQRSTTKPRTRLFRRKIR
jgi:hypothetical protein